MKYSEDFKKRVKQAFPDFIEMHRHLDADSGMLGRYLDDCSTDSLPLDDLKKISSIDELKRLTDEQLVKVALYHEWYENYCPKVAG